MLDDWGYFFFEHLLNTSYVHDTATGHRKINETWNSRTTEKGLQVKRQGQGDIIHYERNKER